MTYFILYIVYLLKGNLVSHKIIFKRLYLNLGVSGFSIFDFWMKYVLLEFLNSKFSSYEFLVFLFSYKLFLCFLYRTKPIEYNFLLDFTSEGFLIIIQT